MSLLIWDDGCESATEFHVTWM